MEINAGRGRSVKGNAALAAVVIVGAVFSAAAHAAPGDLDPTFSGDGKQRTEFGFGTSAAAATVRQPDGKIVVVGKMGLSADRKFALARYDTDGSLDPSFSGDGTQVTAFGAGDGFTGATGVALQDDGKIIAVGRSGAADFALARYNPNGSLDTSFAGDGRQTTDFGGVDGATGVVLQGDGKIVTVGFAEDGMGGSAFAVTRYNPDGSLDTSFSGDGKQVTAFTGHDEATGVALQGTAKIVVVGHAGFGDFAVARYNPGGSLDRSFSGDGRQTTSFGGDDRANAVAVQGGKIVAVGRGDPGNDFVLARYDTDGSLDMTFAGDGRRTTDFGGDDAGNAVAVQATGKIVAVGAGGAANDFALARYDTNGSLDTSFDGDGKQTTDFGGNFDGAYGVALEGDGRIVAAGFTGTFGALYCCDFAIARYNFDGALDPSFSGDGMQTTDFAGFDAAAAVAVQDDGKLVVVGGAGSDFALARYNPDGSLDTTFSGDGRQTTNFGALDGAADVEIQPNGKIVVAGRGGTGGDFALARYQTDGSLDTSFSGDGKQRTAIKRNDGATGMALQANGKIVAVGFAGGIGSSTVDFAVVRYNADGSLDTTFSDDGKQTTDFGVGGANGVALQGAKIIAVGAGGGGFALARYNADGSLDTTFSGDGKQTTGFTGGGSANDVAIQGTGKIVAGGTGGGNFALARYNANGSLDTSFAGDGRQTTDFGGDFDAAHALALQGDDKIVAVGRANRTAGDDFALARYNADGPLDTTFSGDGKETTNFGGNDQANGVALQDDGKIVAVGTGLGTDGTSDFALARYLGG